MAAAPSKRVVLENKRPMKCSHPCPPLIYDDPYIFRVRSQPSRSYSRPCATCLKELKRQQSSSTENIQYQKRCSRLPPKPIELQHVSRSKTAPSNCNWDNFMKKKSKYAINTPYALCNLTIHEEDSENRPAFVNYGGRYNDKQSGEKRTFNSAAVHQLKHHEVDEQRLNSLFRERHLRHQAEKYFREMR